jgi:anti-sigma B factor antagonist
MTPEHADVERLCDSLTGAGSTPRVIVDLSDVELVGSAFTARLIALNKRMRAAGGRLVLCGLCPFVRDTFRGSRLDRVFEVADDEQAALASF